jgi:type VI secretion system protein ImpH
VGTLTDPRRSAGGHAEQPLELTVSFLGLIGASGVLPLHYSAETIARNQNQDRALAEFFDIFQHRAVSLFYRAWRKYRLPFELEPALRRQLLGSSDEPRESDLFSFVLMCLVGLGTEGLGRRLAIADETAAFYAGHFTHAPRSALALERMVGDYFGLAAEVRQFAGRWLALPSDQRTTMPSAHQPRGSYCALGRTSIVGSRVWDVQTRFRVRLGPMSYRQFLEFLPGGAAMRRLADLVRLYVGPALEFEVQPVLKRDEVPTAQLGGAGAGKTMLTRNGWLATRRRERDADEAVFQA